MAFDPTGQALYRALSQRQNPYRDRPQSEFYGDGQDDDENPPGGTTPPPQPTPPPTTPPPTVPPTTPDWPQPIPTPTPMGQKSMTVDGQPNASFTYEPSSPQPTPQPDPAKPIVPAQQALTNALGTDTAVTGQDPYEYLSAAKRREGGSGGMGATIGSTAGGILGSIGGGAALGGQLGSFGGPIGSAAGGLIGGAIGALGGAGIGRRAESAPTDFSVADATTAIQEAYKTYFGREASPEDVQRILVGQGLKPGGQWVGEQGMAAVLEALKNDPEAIAYAQKQAAGPAAATTTTPAPTATPTPTAGGQGLSIEPPTTTPLDPREANGTLNPDAKQTLGGTTPVPTAGGGTPGAGILNGFDQDKINDPSHVTPKYVFARIAQKYDVRDLAQRQAMLAELKADPSGFFANASLGGSKGDKLSIGGSPNALFDGITEFDIIQAAGEGGRAWTWQPITGETATGGGGTTDGPFPLDGSGDDGTFTNWMPKGSTYTPKSGNMAKRAGDYTNGPYTVKNNPNLINNLLAAALSGNVNFGAGGALNDQMLQYLMSQLALGGALKQR